jgi:hypothetical protein
MRCPSVDCGYRGSNAISNARFFSRLHGTVMRVFDDSGNVIETHEHVDDFKEP